MLNFEFLEKGLGIVSPPHFENDFSLFYQLPVLLEIMAKMCIEIVY